MEEQKANNVDDDSGEQAAKNQDPFPAKPLPGESIKVAVRIRPRMLWKRKKRIKLHRVQLQRKLYR